MEVSINGVTYSLNIQGAEQYGTEATAEDLVIYDHIKTLCPSAELVRTTPAYLTARAGDYDLIRFKYTDRAKWVNIPLLDLGKVKRRFESLEDLSQFDADILKAFEMAQNFAK